MMQATMVKGGVPMVALCDALMNRISVRIASNT